MRVICTLLFIVFIFSQSCPAELIIVPDSYTSIVSACEVAVAGDTVGVREGVYYESTSNVGPGVTVIGLVTDSTLVKVYPLYQNDIFVALSGNGAITIENMELHGHSNVGVIGNFNDELVVQRCILVVIGNDHSPTGFINTFADIAIRQCGIWVEGDAAELFTAHDTADIIFEDCVINLPGWFFMSIPSGCTVELRNNTFIKEICFLNNYTSDFSFIAVNNIFVGVAFYPGGGHFPDTLEWRHNDFVNGLPSPSYGYYVGNFSLNPQFCDPGQWPSLNNDYRLKPESPCRMAGEHGEDVGARLGICWPVSAVNEPDDESPIQLFVSEPYPNPTIGNVTISAQLPTASIIRFEIHDISGRVVFSKAPELRRGVVKYNWNGTLLDGSPAPAGTYYARLSSGNEVVTRPLCILR